MSRVVPSRYFAIILTAAVAFSVGCGGASKSLMGNLGPNNTAGAPAPAPTSNSSPAPAPATGPAPAPTSNSSPAPAPATGPAPAQAASPTGPTPPAYAVAFTNLESSSGWGNCLSAGCSGSSNPASYWMAQHQTSPSLDGASTHFYVNGSPYADVLWWKQLNPVPQAMHFLMDFWVKMDPDAAANAEALEFDFVQLTNGRRFDISNQCHYTLGVWDTWDAAGYQWVHTNVPCKPLDPNVWHHIQILAERTDTQTHNISYTVDGVTLYVPDQYAWHHTSGASVTTQNVQVQLDTNGNGGSVGEFIDKLTLYVW